MDAYGVDGIPHLEFLDARGESEGFIVGKFPREVLEKNVSALEAGETTLPYAKQYGKASAAEPAASSRARILARRCRKRRVWILAPTDKNRPGALMI